MKETKVICQNCEKPHEDGYTFCPHCGQKANDDLTIGVLFYNTISNYFSFDARFLKSFFPLMFRPGYLAEKFIEGKRLLYLHPAQMYLFVSVIFFFLLSFNTRDFVTKADEINQQVVNSDENDQLENEAKLVLDSIDTQQVLKSLEENEQFAGLAEKDKMKVDSIIKNKSKIPAEVKTSWDFNKKNVDSLIAAGAEEKVILKEMGMSDDAGYFEKRLYKNMLRLIRGSGAGSIVQAFFDSIPIAMFFLLPIFALLLKIFYFNKGRYAHHLVFSFYFFSFLFTVSAILFSINNFIYDIPGWIDALVIVATYIYFLLALIRFYRQGWFLSWLKSGMISFVFLLMIIPMTFAVLAIFSFLFY